MSGKRVLLIIAGGVAAYKSLDLIRRLREREVQVRVILTRAGAEFVTPLSVGAIAGEKAYTDLFDAESEFDVGHIRLARDTDLVIVAPATADILAKMAAGQANDLATSVLLATGAPVLAAPAMNPHMWNHPATARNVARLAADGISFVGPNEGEMAESGEWGLGRMAEVPEILEAALRTVGRDGEQPLAGRHILVTSGPTHEPIDPVRYIANRSSGRQGHAIAAAALSLGASVTLVTGPTQLADPPGARVIAVETADEMLAAVSENLPADIFVSAAAVADWKAAGRAAQKIKKDQDAAGMALELTENPDILRTISAPGPNRPTLVIGFAAETERVVENAKAKHQRKGCDWIVANDVSQTTGVFGGTRNSVHLITSEGVEDWPEMAKGDVAQELMRRAGVALGALKSAAE